MPDKGPTHRARSTTGLILGTLCVATLNLVLTACHRPPPANPHYVLGSPYQAGGVWYYPRESFDLQETGLATVYPSGHADLTSDGEQFDQTALAASHQTLQLPAIARLTNLENGRQILVRINDRGPATPHRLIAVTRRSATLLGYPTEDVARVRLQVLPAESHAAVEAVPGAPKLELATAPLGAVQQSDLPPPGSAAPENVGAAPALARPPAEMAATTELRLPDTVAQVSADPGNLYVRLGTFQNFQYADIQRAQVAGLGARIVSTREGRVQTHRVIIGPFTSVQQADVVLDQVLRAGVTDARIVVE
jgi:rare lipoprotein A